ncbi:hypothetical protein ACFLUF_01850 [Chloroflexota bacterium]
MEETKNGVFSKERKTAETPQRFLALEEVMKILEGLEVKTVIYMGAEPAIDPRLSQLDEALHKELKSYNILLTKRYLANVSCLKGDEELKHEVVRIF